MADALVLVGGLTAFAAYVIYTVLAASKVVMEYNEWLILISSMNVSSRG